MLQAMLRQLRHHPAFAGTLHRRAGVGVAVTTAMFSVVYGVLLRDLPYGAPDRLVTLTTSDPRIPEGRTVRRRRRLLRLAGAPAGVRGAGPHAAGRHLQSDRVGRARTPGRRARHRQPVRHARRRADPGPLLHRGRGARAGPGVGCRDPRSRVVAAPLRQRPRHRRPDDPLERRQPRGRRRDGAGVPLPVARRSRCGRRSTSRRGRWCCVATTATWPSRA